MMRRRVAFPARERGAVLFVALIILVVMTLIGVTAMQGSVMDERMAGNFKESQRAFQVAEAALRLGEEYAIDNTPGSAGYDSGLVEHYSSGYYLNPDEVLPEVQYVLSAPLFREVTSATGDTATGAKGASKKLYTRRYLVDATGTVGTAGTTVHSSYVIADY